MLPKLFKDEWVNLTELGKPIKKDAYFIGKILTALGLKHNNTKATDDALKLRVAMYRGKYKNLYWNADKIFPIVLEKYKQMLEEELT